MAAFEALGIPQWLADTCSQMGFKAPTPIQSQCIPRVLSGQNVIGNAQTGSGKTAAFALPLLTKLAQDPYGIFALVLTPTRELAFQIDEQFKALGTRINLTTTVIVGGFPRLEQLQQLSTQPHVVIATPGRLAWLIREGEKPYFENLAFLVLDEADRLFEGCFQDDLNVITKLFPDPPGHQTLLFSATITKAVTAFQSTIMVDDFLQVQSEPVATLDQKYLTMPQNLKQCYLVYLLNLPEWKEKSVIIFVATCKGCQILQSLLTELEIDCLALHSGLDQQRRMASLGKFRAGHTRLVATDVASRGLDIPQVALVVNFDVPRMAEDYQHRIGRTARAGRGGQAITFVSQYDVAIFQAIETAQGKTLELYKPFNEEKALALLPKVSEAARMAKIRTQDFALLSRKTARPKGEEDDSAAEKKAVKRTLKNTKAPKEHNGDTTQQPKKIKRTKAKLATS